MYWSSSLSTRQSSTFSRTTQAKTFFCHRDGKTEIESAPSPFVASNVGDCNGSKEVLGSLLQNSKSDSFDGWNILNTEKPRVEVAEPAISFIGLPIIDRCITSYYSLHCNCNGDPKTNILVSSSNTARSVVSYFGSLVLRAITQCVVVLKDAVPYARNGNASDDMAGFTCSEEDGLYIPANQRNQQHSHEVIPNMEPRIRRGVSTSNSVDQTKPNENDTATNQDSDRSTVVDESFWVGSDKDRTSQYRNYASAIELTVNVRDIQLVRHAKFTKEETIAGQIMTLYEFYRERLDAGNLHFFMKRLISISDYIQNQSDDSISHANFHDLLDATEKLLVELKCVKDFHDELNMLWEALLKVREEAGFVCTDIDLKYTASTASDVDFDNDFQQLVRAITLLRMVMNNSIQQNQLPITETTKALTALEEMLGDDMKQFRQLHITKSSNAAKVGWIPKDEKIRRRKISSESYFARLEVDDKVVGDTRGVHIEWPSFTIRLLHSFHCKLSDQPEKVCIQILLQKGIFLPTQLVCSIFLDVPHINATRSSERIESVPVSDWYEFANSNGLKGKVFVSTSVEINPTSHAFHLAMVPRQIPRSNRKTLLRSSRLWNDAKKKEPVNDTSIYDRQLMMAFKCGDKTLISTSLQEPTRHILLKYRQNNGNVPFPIPISTIDQTSDYSAFLKHDNEDIKEELIDSALAERSAVDRDNAIAFFEAIIEQSLLYNRRKARIKKLYSEVIQDVGWFHCFGQGNFGLPGMTLRKRSLAPSHSRQLSSRSSPRRHSLFFSIVLGKNIPVRLADNLLTENGSEKVNHLGLVVKIELRGKFYYTKVVKNPPLSTTTFWNETIMIPLDWINQDDHDHIPLILENESIVMTVFDCVDIDLRDRGGYYDDEETRLLDYLYMGSATVPLNTVLQDGNIDGFIQCSSPDHIVGYSSRLISPLLSGADESESQYLSRLAELVLRVYITTDPIIATPSKPLLDYPSNEHQSVLSRVKQWTELYLKDINCPVLWPDINSVSCLVLRYLTEQNPPRIGPLTLKGCAHYVSLLPGKKNWESLKKLNMDQNLVLSSQQAINILAGDSNEHAVLLANYFLYLSSQNSSEYSADVYLVLGFSIPEGNTAWVIRKDKRSGEIALWDATSARCYTKHDDSIPLQKIYCLVSTENVYANIHAKVKPHSLNFDIKNQKQWAPLLHKDLFPQATMNIQEEVLRYSQPNYLYAKELQDDLKDSIKTAMREWRRTATTFRTDLVPKLTSILDKKEQAKLSGKDLSAISLEVTSKTKNVFGFSLHFSFTNIEDIVNKIRTTSIHNNRNPSVEFTLVVRAFPYPGGVMSVWVYICALVPK